MPGSLSSSSQYKSCQTGDEIKFTACGIYAKHTSAKMSNTKVAPEAGTDTRADVEWLDEDELEHLDEQQRLVAALGRLYVAGTTTPDTEPDNLLSLTRFIQNLTSSIDPHGSMDEAALLQEQVAHMRALAAVHTGPTPPNTPSANVRCTSR